MINLSIRDNAKQLAIENMQKENQKLSEDIEILKKEKQELQKENDILKAKEENKLYNKIKKRIKGEWPNE